jgi:hypothetical protein
MNSTLLPVDITTMTTADLLRLVEEINATRTPRVLKRENKTVAMLLPVAQAIKPRKLKLTKADYEAFRSAAGGWKEVDTDILIQNIYATRKHRNHPSIKL